MDKVRFYTSARMALTATFFTSAIAAVLYLIFAVFGWFSLVPAAIFIAFTLFFYSTD